MDFLMSKELEIYKSEKKNNTESNDAQKVAFAMALENGYGEKMINEIKNPYIPTKKDIFNFKIKMFFHKLNNLFSNKKKEGV